MRVSGLFFVLLLAGCRPSDAPAPPTPVGPTVTAPTTAPAVEPADRSTGSRAVEPAVKPATPDGGRAAVLIAGETEDSISAYGTREALAETLRTGMPVQAGPLLTLPSGTKVLVLREYSGEKIVEIMIEEGAHAGRTCFVRSADVR